MHKRIQRSAFIASLSPLSVKYFGVSRRSRVIGAHSEFYRLRMNPPGNAVVNSCVVACWCWRSRASRSTNPARARRAVPVTVCSYDAAVFSTGISSIYMDDTRHLVRAFCADSDVNCAPLLVNALDGENCPIQVMDRMAHRVRQADSRSTQAVRC